MDALTEDQPLNFDEPQHVRMLRDSMRRFVDAEMPREKAREWDRGNIFPREVMAKLGATGMMGLTTEERYGGAGIDIYATMAVIEELAKRSVAVACPYIMAVCYAGMNLGERGSEAQKQALLPKVASGNLLFAYGLSEPNVGGDIASVETHARREGDEIVINGSKRWCTGAHIADYIFCLLRSGPKEARYKNLSIVLVPPTLPGISVTLLGHLGIRGVETKDVSFDEVRVPAANILGGEEMWNRGWEQLAGRALEVEKLELSACALGLARGAIDELVALAGGKTPQGSSKPLATRAKAQIDVSEAEALVRTARAFLDVAVNAAWDAASRDGAITIGHRRDIRLATTHAVRSAARAVDLMYTLAGGSSVYRSSALQRHFRDVHVATQHMMVSEATYELTGRLFLGMPTNTAML